MSTEQTPIPDPQPSRKQAALDEFYEQRARHAERKLTEAYTAVHAPNAAENDKFHGRALRAGGKPPIQQADFTGPALCVASE
jgi:hypothetical protein